MTINQIIDLSGGVLLSSPSISKISTIKINPSRIQRGDLFVHSPFYDDINLAISNGAYAVITTQKEVSDQEIAWITVHDTQVALLKLMRFFLTGLEIDFLYVSEVQYRLLDALVADKRVLFLHNAFYESIEVLLNSSQIELIVSHEQTILEMLSSHIEQIEKNHSLIECKNNSLFFTSVNDIELPIPKRFCLEVEDVFTVKAKYNLQFRSMNRVTSLYEPHYITNNYELTAFGLSDRVVIVDTAFNERYMSASLSFFNDEANWLNKSIYIPSSTSIQTTLAHNRYASIEELHEKLLLDKQLAILLFINENESFSVEKYFPKAIPPKQLLLF